MAFKNKKLYDEAIEEYQKALNFDPNNNELLLNLADCYDLKGDKKASEDLHKRANPSPTS